MVCLQPVNKCILFNLIKDIQSLPKNNTSTRVEKKNSLSSFHIKEVSPSFHPPFLSSSHLKPSLLATLHASSKRHNLCSFLSLFSLKYIGECRIFLINDLLPYNCCSMCTLIHWLTAICLWQRLKPWPLLCFVWFGTEIFIKLKDCFLSGQCQHYDI